MATYAPQPPLLDAPTEDEKTAPEFVDLRIEVDNPDAWEARPVLREPVWRPRDWTEGPQRFIDGKDLGETILWLEAPYGGYPVPVRLSQIGAVAVRVVDGVCRREYAVVERVVSMVVDPFPWDEVESFAAALQEQGLRLLPAPMPGGEGSYDFEVMRKAAENRSNTEMGVLEEAVLARANMVPTVVDGRLEPRSGGLDQERSPVVGVVKSHWQNYLHPKGLRVLYNLAPGERTPLFRLLTGQSVAGTTSPIRLPVVSWYVRLTGSNASLPNWGYVRVELPARWFERLDLPTEGLAYVTCLSRTLCEYRTRDSQYGRAPVSLHPIVRAEQVLGALFAPTRQLNQRFCRLIDL
jgi:hypothetical protein